MNNYICTTCGTQFAESSHPPTSCPICEDERQFVNAQGQQWTTLEALRDGHQNLILAQEPHLYGIGTTPSFAIGQRALLVQTDEGNLLWDSISLLDDATITAVNELGGIQAIAISHPHFYSSAVEWAKAFDAPLYLHANDKAFVMRPDPVIQYWNEASKTLFGKLTLIKVGGHFEGSTVLHWPQGAYGKGAIFTGDGLMVASDRKHVSFMWSYPNYIPLKPSKVRQVVAAIEPYSFDRIYAAWWDRLIVENGKTAVSISAERYLEAVKG